MKSTLLRHAQAVLALFFLLPQPIAAAEQLTDYLAEAMEHNEDIQAARAGLHAARQKARQSGTLPDPKLGVQYYIEPVETRTGPQDAAGLIGDQRKRLASTGVNA